MFAPCQDGSCENAMLLRGDLEESRLPWSDLDVGHPFPRTHRDIYQTLRPNRACPVLQRIRMGVSGPDGKHFCSTHMSPAVLPAPERPRVQSECDSKHPREPAQCMGNIPDDVLWALASSISDKDGLGDRDIFDHLIEGYGGSLLRNSLRIRRLREAARGAVILPVPRRRLIELVMCKRRNLRPNLRFTISMRTPCAAI